MEKLLRLEGEKVILQSFTREDAELLVKWRQDADVIRYFLAPRPVTLEQHLEWFDASYSRDAGRVDFIVSEKAGGRQAGTAGLKEFTDGCPEVSYTIGEEDMRGKGLAKDAVLTLMRYARERLGAEYMVACIHHDNRASLGLAESLGFHRRGKLDGNNDFYIYHVKL